MGKIPDVPGRGFLELDASLRGAELEIGHRVSPGFSVSGYVAQAWNGGGRTAGARAKLTW